MIRRFLALSRSTHGVLDIAMPGFAALLWLGRFPSGPVLTLCLLTALARRSTRAISTSPPDR